MMSLFLWSQLVVSLALLLDLLSFQLRDRRRILACLALSCALNAGHFALLGQWSAASLLLLASVRFLVSIWLVRSILMWFFMGLACAAALATYQGLLSWIGLLASLLQTRAAFCPDDRQLRRWMLLGTLCWLGNNLLGLTGRRVDGGAVSGQQSGGLLPPLWLRLLGPWQPL